jgi:hypothetical protein
MLLSESLKTGEPLEKIVGFCYYLFHIMWLYVKVLSIYKN